MTCIKIIAEIGINHDGSNEIARKLIQASANSGVNAIKFQYRNLDNAYSSSNREIGDELLLKEIQRTYIQPAKILRLMRYAHKLGLEAGISFFDAVDMDDFGEHIEKFDFMKLPSAELSNAPLIRAMLNTSKHVYISTGCHNENEVEAALCVLPDEGWTPMHCISNYPVAIQNGQLGYIEYLQKKWDRSVGYSSHDDSWEACILAMNLGATVIERHITFDRNAEGLDHSTSSTPAEFERMCLFAKNIDLLMSGNAPRVSNQGEILNLQNLGRSFFAIEALEAGQVLTLNSLVYRSPNTGAGRSEIDKYLGKKLVRSMAKGSVVTPSLFHREEVLSDDVIEFAYTHDLSLPVRLHDLDLFQNLFPIGAFEFHLSHEEVRSDITLSKIRSDKKYSIHLPDYVSSTQLMDPFSENQFQKEQSLVILNRTVEFARDLQELTGKEIPIVGSFSLVHKDINQFYSQHAELMHEIAESGVEVLMQWLPPIAWYFGGSIELNVLNKEVDAALVRQHDIMLCMDICHLLMGKNRFGFSPLALMEDLHSVSRHIHIADAVGLDGEGLAIGEGESENIAVIKKSLEYNCLKVIEVWQGHLDNGAGFAKALSTLSTL